MASPSASCSTVTVCSRQRDREPERDEGATDGTAAPGHRPPHEDAEHGPGCGPRTPVAFGGHRQEVGDQRVSVDTADGLGMELHAPLRQPPVLQGHDQAVRGPRGDGQGIGDVDDYQGVVADDVDKRRQRGEETGGIVTHREHPAMDRLRREIHAPAVGDREGLMPQADPQNGCTPVAQDIQAHADVPGALRAAGTRRDDDGVIACDAVDIPAGFVVGDHLGGDTGDVLDIGDEIPREGIPVVDDEDTHGG